MARPNSSRNAWKPLAPILAGLLLGLGTASVAAQLTAAQETQYREIRKDFFVALALEPRPGRRLRPEHRRFLQQVSVFLEGLDEALPMHRAATHYFRARLLVRVKYWSKARADFDACLECLARLTDPEIIRPAGLPSQTAIRIQRALAFRPDGVDAVLAQLEAIPPEAPPPAFHEVGNVLSRLAEALADNDDVERAIRTYELVKKFELWEEEQDDPKRKIELLQVRRQAAPPAEPE